MADLKKLHSTLSDVPLTKVNVCAAAQRELKQSRVDFLASEFDPEMFGFPVVNLRASNYYVIDGQHRIAAVKQWLGDAWEKQSITCRVYKGLTEQQEAEMFDRLNNQLTVKSFDKFRVRVTAGRQTECVVKNIVEKCGLKISADKSEGSVGAVSTLVRVFKRENAETLARSLNIVNGSFGTPGLSQAVIDGVSRVCSRYNGALNDDEAIDRLRSLRGGVGQLMTKADLLRKQTGLSVPECVAAATVDVLNSRRGGKKLPPWWKE